MSSADFDRRLNEWFDAVEPRTLPPDLLTPVFGQVARTRQDRGTWHPFTAAAELVRRPMTQVSWGLGLLIVTALLIVALLAMSLAAGIIRLPSKTGAVDGLIAVEDAQTTLGSQVIRFINPTTGADAFTTPSDAGSCGANFSPDGSHYALLYQADDSAPGTDLYISIAPAVADFQPTLLMRKPQQIYFNPAWAPDGRSVASTIEVAGDGGYRELWVLPADGGPGSRLTDIHASFSADWSDDGDWIAFVGVGPTHPLYVIRPDGSDLRTLLAAGGDSVAWSPVAQQLALSSSNAKLHVISLDGTELLAADLGRDPNLGTTPTAGLLVPLWSPDGSQVALAVEGALKIVDIATGSVVNIAVPAPVARAAWSASGETLIVVTAGGDSFSGDLWEVSIDGAASRLIAQGVRGSCMSASVALSWQHTAQP